MNPQGCYLEFVIPELFAFLQEPNPRKNHYGYLGDFVDNNLEIFLFVFDINLNNLTKSKFQDNFTQINSLQYDTDETKYTIIYNTITQAFQFRGKLNFNNGISTWEFFIIQKNMVAVGGGTFGVEKVLTLQQTMEFIYADPFVKMAIKLQAQFSS